jgi:hypothetical protein
MFFSLLNFGTNYRKMTALRLRATRNVHIEVTRDLLRRRKEGGSRSGEHDEQRATLLRPLKHRGCDTSLLACMLERATASTLLVAPHEPVQLVAEQDHPDAIHDLCHGEELEHTGVHAEQGREEQRQCHRPGDGGAAEDVLGLGDEPHSVGGGEGEDRCAHAGEGAVAKEGGLLVEPHEEHDGVACG